MSQKTKSTLQERNARKLPCRKVLEEVTAALESAEAVFTDESGTMIWNEEARDYCGFLFIELGIRLDDCDEALKQTAAQLTYMAEACLARVGESEQ